MRDLIWLVADKNMAATAEALMGRHQAIGTRQWDGEIVVHPRRDPGCFHEAAAFLSLSNYRRTHAHALVMLDRAWAGAPAETAGELETLLRRSLESADMADWAEVLVIDPELEVWVWSDSPHVASSLGWTERSGDLRAWLTEQGLWPTNEAKPPDPKAAVEAVVWHVQTPRSSSIYRKLATNVSLHRCTDASFNRLLGILRTWFPPDAGPGRDAEPAVMDRVVQPS